MANKSHCSRNTATPFHIHEVLQAVHERCRAHRKLSADELERLADMLLRVWGDDPEYPVRSTLTHRSIEVHSLDDARDSVSRAARERPAPPETNAASLQALVARLLVAANLVSPLQRTVARLHLWGYSLTEIAQRLELPYSTVACRWRAARVHLQRAARELAREGWFTHTSGIEAIATEQIAETFRDQQQVCCYQPPRHCPRGRERCRVTGLCLRA